MELKRTFGLWASVSMVIGGIIGSGIFMKPAMMAALVGSPAALLGIWIVAGLISMLGALSNAEVAAMFPETGGQYIFFQKMYGDFVAFLYGWAAFAVFNTAGVASIAYVMATYTTYFIKFPEFSDSFQHMLYVYLPGLGRIFPFENLSIKIFTIAIVGALTVVNYRSTKAGGRLQVIFTMLKVAAMSMLIVGLLFSRSGSFSHLAHASGPLPAGWPLVMALVAAISGAFWGYDGWNNITFVAGEIKNPQRNIPLGLIIGMSGTILIYVLLNLAYLYVLPIEDIAASGFVASDAGSRAFGAIGGGLIAALVILSTFGTTHGNVLATARVTFAMANEKRFFSWVGKVHPKFQTPGNALVVHFLWTAMLIVSGSFDMLTDMLVFVSWVFYGLSAFGVFILRRSLPAVARPYKVLAYPWVPGLFVLAAAIFLVLTVYNDVTTYLEGTKPLINSLFGLLLTALGIPLYYYFRRQSLN